MRPFRRQAGGIGVAEREGFEPSVEVSPYGSLANCCLRPLGHLSSDLSSMRGFPSVATKVDDRWKTNTGGMILPQATWTVQAIRTADEEKVSEGERNRSQVCLLGPPKYDRLLRELNDCG